MIHRRCTTIRRPRASLIWGLAFFLAGQGVFLLTLGAWRQELRDPEYVHRRNLLQRQLQQKKPEQAVVLILGSSRVAMGLRPEVIARKPDAPLVFNFGLLGSGPVMELFCLRRLLADGIRPDLVLVEVWAPFLYQEGPLREVDRLDVDRLSLSDLQFLTPYSVRPEHLVRQWIEAQLSPCFTHRFKVISAFLPAWLPYHLRRDHNWRDLDPWGWLPGHSRADDPAQYRKRFQHVREYFGPVFQKYRLGYNSWKAMREMLSLCRDQGIPVALFCMPEGKDFRALYSPEATRLSELLVGNMHKEYGVPVIDTRDWMGPENFIDSFHLLTDGAWKFTERFEEEVIRPLLHDRIKK